MEEVENKASDAEVTVSEESQVSDNDNKEEEEEDKPTLQKNGLIDDSDDD